MTAHSTTATNDTARDMDDVAELAQALNVKDAGLVEKMAATDHLYLEFPHPRLPDRVVARVPYDDVAEAHQTGRDLRVTGEALVLGFVKSDVEFTVSPAETTCVGEGLQYRDRTLVQRALVPARTEVVERSADGRRFYDDGLRSGEVFVDPPKPEDDYDPIEDMAAPEPQTTGGAQIYDMSKDVLVRRSDGARFTRRRPRQR